MIKSFLFVFFIHLFNLAGAIDSDDCSSLGHEKWMCRYMAIHSKKYNSTSELTLRKNHLKKQKLKNVKMNQAGVRFGLTSRSDRFNHEKRQNHALLSNTHLQNKRKVKLQHYRLKSKSKLSPIDWRDYNGRSYVTSVKDQDACGCCFAFASSTVLEYWSSRQGSPKSISPQHLMDCTSGGTLPDTGCDGGLMEYVFEYANKHPVVLEVDEPYKDKSTTCRRHKMWSHVQVHDYKVLVRDEDPKAEDEIEKILHMYGPVSIGVDSTTMDNYQGGIFKASMCSTDIDHAVTIVGYTKDAWIIKNSWGPYWGENGYLYLERGKNACGVAEYIVYITDATPVLQQMNTHWQY